MLIDATAIVCPSRVSVALPSLDVDDAQVISEARWQLSFSQSDVMERAGGLSNPRFWSFTPLTPPLQAPALKPSTRSDCSCFQHKRCGGQRHDVGEVGPSQCPGQGRCAAECEANNNGSSPAPATSSMSFCDAPTKSPSNADDHCVNSVLHQRRPLPKLPAPHSTPQWLLVLQQLLQLGLQDGTIICSVKRHLP
jgi:hypothetical protein